MASLDYSNYADLLNYDPPDPHDLLDALVGYRQEVKAGMPPLPLTEVWLLSGGRFEGWLLNQRKGPEGFPAYVFLVSKLHPETGAAGTPPWGLTYVALPEIAGIQVYDPEGGLPYEPPREVDAAFSVFPAWTLPEVLEALQEATHRPGTAPPAVLGLYLDSGDCVMGTLLKYQGHQARWGSLSIQRRLGAHRRVTFYISLERVQALHIQDAMPYSNSLAGQPPSGQTIGVTGEVSRLQAQRRATCVSDRLTELIGSPIEFQANWNQIAGNMAQIGVMVAVLEETFEVLRSLAAEETCLRNIRNRLTDLYFDAGPELTLSLKDQKLFVEVPINQPPDPNRWQQWSDQLRERCQRELAC